MSIKNISHGRGRTTEYIIYGNRMSKAGVYFIADSANHCRKWNEKFDHKHFDFLLHFSEKFTEFQKVQTSNQKPSYEIYSFFVPLTDPCVTIKIKDICNHQVLALFANTSH